MLSGFVTGQSRTTASRQARETLTTLAVSDQGGVRVALTVQNGVVFAMVELVPWRGVGATRALYFGRVDGEDS